MSATGDRARSIAALLNRLALHCPIRDLPESQAALRMEDTIRDLLPYEPRKVAEACDAWRRGNNPFFPISGQLIALIPVVKFVSAWDKPAYRATDHLMIAGPPSAPPKPWREILREKGRKMAETAAAEPPKPAEQEALDERGELSSERREQLRELRVKLLEPA